MFSFDEKVRIPLTDSFTLYGRETSREPLVKIGGSDTLFTTQAFILTIKALVYVPSRHEG